LADSCAHSVPDIALLTAAKERARERVQADPSAENLGAFDRAAKMLEARLRPAPEPAHANRLEALKTLKRLGYKVGKSKLYADCSAGRLQLQPDGSVLDSELRAYVRRVGLEKPGEAGREADDSGEVDLERRRLEVAKLEEQVAKLKFDREILEGRYVERDQVALEIAARATVLEAMLRNILDSLAVERRLVDPAGGELRQSVVPADELRAEVSDALDRYASANEFHVLFRRDE